MIAPIKFFKLHGEEKKCFIEATFYCIVFKGMIAFFPLKKYTKLLGAQNIYSNGEPNQKEQTTILNISRSIVRSRKVIPWKSKCLTEAITAKIMLRRRKVSTTLYLGVNKENNSMAAHAWLRSGNTWITGRRGSDRFTIVSSFT